MSGSRKMKMWLEPDVNGNIPTLEELDSKKQDRLRTRAYNYCTWSLGQSQKTAKQLSEKMRIKRCPEQIIDETIEKLENQGLIDNTYLAEIYTSSKRNAGYGTQRIEMELRRKGVSDADIKNATEQETWDDETEEDRARDFAERKVRSISTSGDLYKQRQRLISTMIRRGFPMDISFKLANELIIEGPEDEDESEF